VRAAECSLREENVRTRLELLMQEIQNRNAAGD
jgi:hypothetical protein